MATGKTLKYLSGNITSTGATLHIGFSGTYDTDGVIWSTINVVTGITVTINSTLRAETFKVPNGNSTYAGTHGFNVDSLILPSTSVTANYINLTDNVTSPSAIYTVNDYINLTNSTSTSAINEIKSTHAVNKANLVVGNSAIVNYRGIMTRIDASGGSLVYIYKGPATECVNVVPILQQINTVAKSFTN